MAKRKRRRMKKISHFWVPSERQILVDNQMLTGKQLKKQFFREDKTVNAKAIEMQLYYLKKGIVKVDQISKRKPKIKEAATVNVVKSNPAKSNPVKSNGGIHALELAYENFKKHEKNINEFNAQMSSVISKSPYRAEYKVQLLNDITEKGALEISKKHKELAKSLPV